MLFFTRPIIFVKLPLFVKNIYELLGKNSLLVYAVHSIVLALATVYLQDKGTVVNSIVIFFLFFVIVFVTHLYERLAPLISSSFGTVIMKIKEVSINLFRKFYA